MLIALIGYGKMGQLIQKVALARGHTIACIIDNNKSALANNNNASPQLFSNFENDQFSRCDVAFEFTTPASAYNNILQCWKFNIPVICGTTGWDDTELQKINKDRITNGKKSLLVHKNNFSVGVDMLIATSTFLAKKMEKNSNFKPSITEIHHIHKLDKPSGTATLLSKTIPFYPTPVTSIREGEEIGTHIIRWESNDEIIEISHVAKKRECFALGAVLEAEKLIGNENYVNKN